jgi:hypothetical protein
MWWDRASRILGASLLAGCCHFAVARADVPVKAANQLEVSGNACGPTALLNSFKFGNTSWQKAAAALPGSTDREKIIYWIRRYGKQPSATLKGRNRWTRAGINGEDLLTAANEEAKAEFLPELSMQGLLDVEESRWEQALRRFSWGKPASTLKPGQQVLLSRARKSLAQGFPPLLTLRRYALEDGRWVTHEGHFVTILSAEEDPGKGLVRLRFIDPWGGKTATAEVRVTEAALLQKGSGLAEGLQVESEILNIGKSRLTGKQDSVVIAGNLIGRW